MTLPDLTTSFKPCVVDLPDGYSEFVLEDVPVYEEEEGKTGNVFFFAHDDDRFVGVRWPTRKLAERSTPLKLRDDAAFVDMLVCAVTFCDWAAGEGIVPVLTDVREPYDYPQGLRGNGWHRPAGIDLGEIEIAGHVRERLGVRQPDAVEPTADDDYDYTRDPLHYPGVI